jgi:hypothetical protein
MPGTDGTRSGAAHPRPPSRRRFLLSAAGAAAVIAAGAEVVAR